MIPASERDEPQMNTDVHGLEMKNQICAHLWLVLLIQLHHRGERISLTDHARRMSFARCVFDARHASGGKPARLTVAGGHFPFSALADLQMTN
jgi:hypothetical protein